MKKLPVAALPQNFQDAFGGLFLSSPMICGGNTRIQFNDKCYMLSRNASNWRDFATLKVPRAGASTIALINNFWVIGGVSGPRLSDTLKTTELIDFNGKISAGPNLPQPLVGHTSVQMKRNIVIIGGHNGEEGTKTTYIFGLDTVFIGEGPTLSNERYDHGCCSFPSENHNGRTAIVVVGGWPDAKSVEILDFYKSGSTWEKSKSLILNQFS